MTDRSLYIGLMSGSSLDGIDAALVDFSSDTPQLIQTHTKNIPLSTKKLLKAISFNQHHDIKSIAELDNHMGTLFADATNELLSKASISSNQIIAVGSHGQTIRHQPNNILPYTLQIGDPNIITTKTNITTVADFRRRDIAEGGQGAPLVPAFHDFLFKKRTVSHWVVNIGGIANITYLPADPKEPIIGFDTGPGNGLLDAWFQQHHDLPFDNDGQWAKSGTIQKNLLNHWLQDDFFKQNPPKSTGRDYFNLQWLQKNASAYLNTLAPKDIQATLTELTATTIAAAITNNTPAWICGGGANNNYLITRLQKLLPNNDVDSIEKVNINPNWVEASAFAWFAKQTINKQTTDLTQVTGAKKPSILGGIWLCNH